MECIFRPASLRFFPAPVSFIQHQGELVSAMVIGGEANDDHGPIYEGTVNLAVWDAREESLVLPGEIRDDGRARVVLSGDVLQLIDSGIEVSAMLVRPETYLYARATSDVFALTQR